MKFTLLCCVSASPFSIFCGVPKACLVILNYFTLFFLEVF